MNDNELKNAMRLSQRDEIDLWPKLRKEIPSRTSILEFLLPLAAAAAAILIVQGSLTSKATSAHWPVHIVQLPPPMASIK